MLYEIAFAFGSCTRPFNLYTVMPKTLVSYSGDNLHLDATSPLALIVEEDDDATDPLLYMCESTQVLYK